MNDWDLTAAGANKKIEELEDSLATRFLDRNGIIMMAINDAIQARHNKVTIAITDKDMLDLIIHIMKKLEATPYCYNVYFLFNKEPQDKIYGFLTISWAKE